MKTKSIINGLTIIVLLSLLFACGRKQNESDDTKSELRHIGKTLEKKIADEKQELRTQFNQIISDYRSEAERIKIQAIKNKENLNSEVKKKIIEIENEISLLEQKLDALNTKSTESWNKLRNEVKHDIKGLRESIKNLTVDNVG